MAPRKLSKLRRIKSFLPFVRRLPASKDDSKLEVSLPLERPSHPVLTSQDSGDEMASDFLKPRPQAAVRSRQILEAQKEQQNVTERAQRRGLDTPPYEFLELIGKGSYGRVFKSKDRETQQICAVKIIEADRQDYQQDAQNRDNTLKEFLREIEVLQSLKDKRAENVNIIHKAFNFDTTLWIVSDYCPGGSVTTLLKATTNHRLQEEFIVPIAREVAVALKYIHEAGVIHRDIKCANILVTEDGRIQLCDFGVSGMLEAGVSKRSTIIGTPHWMAPELVAHLGRPTNIAYGTEVDCWAYGVALHEMATGRPPNAHVAQTALAGAINRDPPRLLGAEFSEDLKDYVSFCLKIRPEERPTAAQILEHPYVANTSESHPTKTIRKLLEQFQLWELQGGQRISLFNPMGAMGSDSLPEEVDEGWNFSATEDFERRVSVMFNIDAPASMTPTAARELTPFEKMMEEQKSRRGEKSLAAIFAKDGRGYDPTGRRTSDLPFRNEYEGGSVADRSTIIDLDAALSIPEPNLNLADPPGSLRAKRFFRDDDEDSETLHANRFSRTGDSDYSDGGHRNRRTQDWKFPAMMAPANTAKRLPKDSGISVSQTVRARPKTQDWKFPSAEEMAAASEPASPQESATPGLPRMRPTINHAKTMPMQPFAEGGAMTGSYFGLPSPDRSSIIDLDTALILDVPITRPSTAGSATNSAVSETTTGDPFDLEAQFEDSPRLRSRSDEMVDRDGDRGSYHRQSQSEPTLTSWNREIFGSTIRAQQSQMRAREGRGAGKRRSRPSQIIALVEPSREVLLPGARKDVVKSELGKMGDDVVARCGLGKGAWVGFAGLISPA